MGSISTYLFDNTILLFGNTIMFFGNTILRFGNTILSLHSEPIFKTGPQSRFCNFKDLGVHDLESKEQRLPPVPTEAVIFASGYSRTSSRKPFLVGHVVDQAVSLKFNVGYNTIHGRAGLFLRALKHEEGGRQFSCSLQELVKGDVTWASQNVNWGAGLSAQLQKKLEDARRLKVHDFRDGHFDMKDGVI